MFRDLLRNLLRGLVSVVDSPVLLFGVVAVLGGGALVGLGVKAWRKSTVMGLLFVAILGSMVAAVLLPMLVVPPPSPEHEARVRLKQISLALLMYAADNQEHLPLTLGATFSYINYGGVYVVDRSGTVEPRTGLEVDAGQCDFLYFGGAPTGGGDAVGVVVVTTKPETFESQGYVGVAHMDGQVEIHKTVSPQVKALWEADRDGKPAVLSPSDQGAWPN